MLHCMAKGTSLVSLQNCKIAKLQPNQEYFVIGIAPDMFFALIDPLIWRRCWRTLTWHLRSIPCDAKVAFVGISLTGLIYLWLLVSIEHLSNGKCQGFVTLRSAVSWYARGCHMPPMQIQVWIPAVYDNVFHICRMLRCLTYHTGWVDGNDLLMFV